MLNVQTFLASCLFTMGTLSAAQHLVEGSPQSPVRVLIFEDLQCPDCADFRLLLDQKLLPKYAGSVAFEHRDFPLSKHAWARKAAIAARFFGEQSPELGIAYRRYCFNNLQTSTPANFNDRLVAFAKEHKVDPASALAALDDQRLAALVEDDFQDGIARGIARTPTALVNGRPYIETITLEEISKGIDEELKAAK
jgi:protein-disulfide isomerase